MTAGEKAAVMRVMREGVKRLICSCADMLPPPLAMKDDTARIDRHRHREILFVVAGESPILIDERWYELAPGDMVLFEPWQRHSFYYRDSDRNLKHLWGYWHKNIYLNLTVVNDSGQIDRGVMNGHIQGPAAELVKFRWNLVKSGEVTAPEDRERLLRQAGEVLLEEFILSCHDQSRSRGRHAREVAKFLDEYIGAHNGVACGLAHLAVITGYDRYYLSHLFREYNGKSIGMAIDEARLACMYAAQARGLPNKEIAGLLGFSSAMSFWKWRRKACVGGAKTNPD